MEMNECINARLYLYKQFYAVNETEMFHETVDRFLLVHHLRFPRNIRSVSSCLLAEFLHERILVVLSYIATVRGEHILGHLLIRHSTGNINLTLGV